MVLELSTTQTYPVEKETTNAQTHDVDMTLGMNASIAEDDTSHTWLAREAAKISPERRIVIEKKLIRRIDSYLFPMLLAFYILNYIVSNIDPQKN